MDEKEVLCLFNSHGYQIRSADVLIDAVPNRIDGKGVQTVVFNSAQEAARSKSKRCSGAYHKGSKQMAKRAGDIAYVEIWDLAQFQVLVLASHLEKEKRMVTKVLCF